MNMHVNVLKLCTENVKKNADCFSGTVYVNEIGCNYKIATT